MHKQLLAARQGLQMIAQTVSLTANGSLWIGCVKEVGLYCGQGDGAVEKLNAPKSSMGKLTIGQVEQTSV